MSRLIFVVPFTLCMAQPPATPRFEVSSIKPAAPRAATSGGRDGGGGGCSPRGTFAIDHARVDIGCASLAILIARAFRVPADRVVGPDWLRGAQFDVAATLPEDAKGNQVPEMLQALLAERFHLTVHRGTRQQEVCALVVAKSGAKMKMSTAEPDSTAPDPEIGVVKRTDGPDFSFHWEAPSITAAGLADLLQSVGPLPEIVNMTGLNGRYEVDLTVSLHDADVSARAARTDPAAKEDVANSVLKALNSGLLKFGLQLERRKGSVETIVVDHLEKTPSGN